MTVTVRGCRQLDWQGADNQGNKQALGRHEDTDKSMQCNAQVERGFLRVCESESSSANRHPRHLIRGRSQP